MKQRYTFILILILAITVAIASPHVVQAQGVVPSDCSDSLAATTCGLDDMVLLFINLYNIGIQYVGGVALLFFVIGGFMLLISGGRSDRVEMGKKILTGAVVGIFIVMTSYFIVYIVQKNIFDARDEFTITADTECAGRPDGSACSLVTPGIERSQRVYTCIEGVCRGDVSQCEYHHGDDMRETTVVFSNGNRITVEDGMRCWPKSDCDESTILTNKCPGVEDIVCCHVPAVVQAQE